MIKEQLEKNKTAIWSTFLWGILAHGMMLFNKFSFHDDAGLFHIGLTYSLGRWMLGILDSFSRFFLGSGHYSTPLFHGLMTIAFVAGCAVTLIKLFEIKNKWLVIGLSGTLIVFPAVASTFGYMFTAPYYFLGTWMGILGAYICCKCSKWYLYLAGLLLMACSAGVYQANIPVYVSVILIYMLKETACREHGDWMDFFRMACRSVLSLLGAIGLYFVLNQTALWRTGMQLSDYQGINNMGTTSVKGYLRRILTAYREFFVPTDGTIGNMYPFSADVVYQLILVLAGIATLCLLYGCFKKDIFLGLQVSVLVFCLPLAVHFIYFMCGAELVDSMMTYGELMIFVYVAWLMEAGWLSCIKIQVAGRSVERLLTGGSIALLLILNVMFCRIDNICYLKAEFMQSQAISYFTALSAQIRGVEGYTAETPVVYINEYEKYDYTMANIPEFKEIHIIPYDHSSIINSYSWKVTMKMWCNFDPVYMEAGEYAGLPEIQEMPSYPSTGSIRMLDDVLIVKF